MDFGYYNMDCMDPEQYEKLVTYCHQQDRPISWAIQKALDNYLPD